MLVQYWLTSQKSGEHFPEKKHTSLLFCRWIERLIQFEDPMLFVYLCVYLSICLFVSIYKTCFSWKSERFFERFFGHASVFLASEWYSQMNFSAWFTTIFYIVICYCYGRAFGGNTWNTMGWTNRKRNFYGFALSIVCWGKDFFCASIRGSEYCKTW